VIGDITCTKSIRIIANRTVVALIRVVTAFFVFSCQTPSRVLRREKRFNIYATLSRKS
jgi:hypothetical protein